MPTLKFSLTISILILGTLACNALAPQPDTADPSQVQQPSPNGELPASEADVPRVSLDDAKAAAENGTAIIVDVRSAESFANGHIPGAVNIPLSLIEADPTALDLEKDEWIITYCT
ncbi:MAG: rhodanese-like domain-containing protein [Anaerolineales bacterium]|nr:rhodanese-like domain-containing protein [Anaerolineales bacterium]